jgi:hypothetical protein
MRIHVARPLCVGLCALAVAFVGFAPSSAMADPPSTPSLTYGTNGTVEALARLGNTIYLGGVFSNIGLSAGGAAALSNGDGTANPTFPAISGNHPHVNAVVPDGSGGWYIGGVFTHVGGVPRNGLAHILPDGSVDPNFDPSPNGPVDTLALAGSTLYAGGVFSSIGGLPRNTIAALDTSDGSATRWNPSADGRVLALAVSGSTVYAGGQFTNIGGQPRNHIAALDANIGTNNATSWDPNADQRVRALAVDGSTVYAGGDFTNIGGEARNHIAALDANTATNNATTWDPNADSSVYALAISGSTVYAGGDFSTIGGQTRNHIAALNANLDTNNATSWDPNADGAVFALAVDGSTVYAGGDFFDIGGQARNHIAALDANTDTNNATSWDPNADDTVLALAVDGSTVYAGGFFSIINQMPRNNLAAIDAVNGRPTNWDPNADGGPVFALAASGSTVYVGGIFNGPGSIGGADRNFIAGVDATTGNATGWDPEADGPIFALTLAGPTVYAGGVFGNIGGQPRNNIAALDASSGNATAWDPNADSEVGALAVSGSTVYAGGSFTSIGGQTRNHIAGINTSTGNVTAFDPDADGCVCALAVSGSTVYAGGNFTNIGGQTRNRIAALRASTGAATSWDPNANDEIDSLAVVGSTVYVGGYFNGSSSIGGADRNGIAGIDTSTGAATGFDPNSDDAVFALMPASGALFAGGQFASMDTGPSASFAAFVEAPSNTAVPTIPNGASPAVGTKLGSNQGRWTGLNNYVALWLSCDADGISNCTQITPFRQQSTYGPVLADAGHTLRVVYLAYNLAGANTATSDSTGVVTQPVPTSTFPPTITNGASPAVGAKMGSNQGRWTGGPTSYQDQWLRCDTGGSNCTAINAYGTVANYKPVPADAGHTLRVRYIATNAAGDSSPATSDPSGVVTQPVPTNISQPSIKNGASPAVGTKLGSDQGAWTGSPTSYQARWLRCDTGGSNCTTITAYVNSGTYRPVSADVGHTLRVQYIATNGGGDSTPATSDPSGVVN